MVYNKKIVEVKMRKKKIKGDEYLAMKKEKKSKGRKRVEKAGMKTIVMISSALSAIVLGYTARKFAGVQGKHIPADEKE